MGYVKALREHFGNKVVFSMRDLRIFFSRQKISSAYRNLLVHNLLKKGEMVRITKGRYTFQKDSCVFGFAFSPFYYGLQEALSLRKLWGQETVPVIITAKKFRPGIREIGGSKIIIKRIGRKMFFGFDFVKQFDFELPVSDPEKTLIDFAYFRQQLDPAVLHEIKKRIDGQKLRQYLLKCPKYVKVKIEKWIGNKY